MTAQKGDDVILKTGDGGTPTESFTNIGGLINTSFSLNNEIIEASDLSSGKYRKIYGQTGIKSLIVRGGGYFTGSTSEEMLRGYAFSTSANNYELHFGNGDKLYGAFIISAYERSGNYASQESFDVILESSGNINFTKGV